MLFMNEENFINYLSGKEAQGMNFIKYKDLIRKFPDKFNWKIRAKIHAEDITKEGKYCIRVQKFVLNIKKNWCVGYSDINNHVSDTIKLTFQADGCIKNKDYIFIYSIIVNLKDYWINRCPDYIIVKKFANLEFEEILQVEGSSIKERLENDTEFIKKIYKTIEKQILNNNVFVNF